MEKKKHKIPLYLKLVRLKNSDFIGSFNNVFSYLKKKKKYSGIPEKILFLRNDRIGDAVVTLPVIRNIKLNYPDIKIDVLVSLRNKFVFEDFKYVDEIIDYDRQLDDLHIIYKVPFIGGFLQFIVFILIPYFKSSEIRKKIKYLNKKKYDVAVDLVGLKRNILLCKLISRYSIGPKSFGTYYLYDFYSDNNWVSSKDTDFITTKIENTLKDAVNFRFLRNDTSLPLVEYNQFNSENKYVMIYHLGSTELRKFCFEKEKEIIKSLSGLRLLVLDSAESRNFIDLKKFFINDKNIEFKVFCSLKEIAAICSGSKILICYDGGQAHYLSQFVRTLTIFGPGSVDLWKPFEFAEYCFIEEDTNGCRAIMSAGKFQHITVYYPVWCRPCFDIGCKTKPCLNNISPGFVIKVLNKYCRLYD